MSRLLLFIFSLLTVQPMALATSDDPSDEPTLKVPTFPIDPLNYQNMVVDLAEDALIKVTSVRTALDASTHDRNFLKVCHTIGGLSAQMVRLAEYAVSNFSRQPRRTMMDQIMPAVAELNQFCGVIENIPVWKPRVAPRGGRDVLERLRLIEMGLARIESGQIR